MATHEHARVSGRLFSGPFIVLLIFLFLASIVLIQRFVFGLGAATNLNDGYPWGIWIAIDLIIGTALGCGGFVMAFLVYILNRGEYHPLARAGLMTSLFGYSLGGLAVLIDLGRYWQGYTMMFPWLWNVNSVMLETALCIAAYTTVLLIEFAPSVFERFGLNEARRRLHKVLFAFTALGVLLPMMHQSSMGTIVVLLGYKLSPLWHSQMLTVLFLITAISMGFAIVAFESLIASVAFKRPYDTRILSGLCGIMVWVILIFIVVRFVDVSRLGALPLAFNGSLMAWSFWIEMLVSLFAVACLMPVANRSDPRFIFLGASSILMSGFLYRLNCYLIGYDPGNGWSYYPSIGEIIVTLGIFSLHIVLYLIFVKQLPVLHATKPIEHRQAATITT